MKQNKKEKFYEELVQSVRQDFLKRREERRGAALRLWGAVP